ncbi:hypothetical protein LCGC14_1997380 [marine sediment metagenome]|uniref:Uncharacterized protein n=1 Tax=marine sediment metagenome TaxID=412755 RepID=A0A0F9FS78_9ZZZZ
MDREELKNRIDFNNIQEREIEMITGIPATLIKEDYLVDFEGNFILPISPIEMKLIDKIKDLEAKIIELEKRG